MIWWFGWFCWCFIVMRMIVMSDELGCFSFRFVSFRFDFRFSNFDHELKFWNWRMNQSESETHRRKREAIILCSRVFRLTFSETVAPPNSLKIPFTFPTHIFPSLLSSDPQEPGGTGYDSTNIYPGHWGVYPWRKSHGILIPKGGSIHSFGTGLWSPRLIIFRTNEMSIPAVNRTLGYCWLIRFVFIHDHARPILIVLWVG